MYLLKGHTAELYWPSGGFKVRNNIALTLTVCTTLFKMKKLQRKRLRQSRAIAFSLNRCTHG